MTPLERNLRSALARAGSSGLRSDHDLNPGGRSATRLRPPRKAAVLVPVIGHPESPTVLLTRRADHLPRHAGQVSFPGGAEGPEDCDPLACALREFEEEVGLPADDVTVLGRLDSYETVTGFHITPFVGLLRPPLQPRPDPAEVADVFEVALSAVADRDRFETRSVSRDGVERRFYVLRHDTHYIWGATAHMLVNLRDILAAAPERKGETP